MKTPLGRHQFFLGIGNVLWPLCYILAKLYRILTRGFTRQIVVVGSLGKTTAWRAAAVVLGLDPDRGMYNNFRTAIAMQVLRVPPWKKYAVTEVGIDGPGQMVKFAGMIKPQATIVTSIASEHQQSLKNLETTRLEKSKIVRNMSTEGCLFINGDDPNALWIGSQTNAPVVTYGFGSSCQIRAKNYRLDWPRGSCFDVVIDGKIHEFNSMLPGRHMVYPVLSALALAGFAGVSLDLALSRLETLAPAFGRMDTSLLQGGAYLIRDDFKSTIETIYSALEVLAMIPARSRGLIIGDISGPPGPQGPLYRDLGSRIAEIADWVVFYGNKRDAYAAGARSAGMPKDTIEKERDDLAGVAERARKRLQPGDVVMVKGRDTQRLDRISLALEGIPVKCDIRFCDARAFRCHSCPMLKKGWEDKKVMI